MPFYPITLTISAQVVAVLIGFFIVAAGDGSLRKACRRLFTTALVRLWPVGAAYGLGDLLQAFACNSASAPVWLVVGQCKLLLTAVLSVAMLGSRAPIQWGQLSTISCAGIAGAHTGAALAGSQLARRGEVRGAALALAKAGLSASGAVFTEKFFKEEQSGFWEMGCRVQLLMLGTTCLIFAGSLVLQPSQVPSSLAEFFLGGPEPLCTESGCSPCGPALLGVPCQGECACLDRVGWDSWTVLVMLAIVLNGAVTGLTLKYLSAVGKAVCNTLSVALFYPAYVMLGFKPFDWTQAAILIIIIINTYQYTTHAAARRTRPHHREAVQRRHPTPGCPGRG